ncbi:MAG: TRAP transporter large permease subunit [Treponema sp.]|nr:TRAP transporter large permease subunit [Treponema sp.]
MTPPVGSALYTVCGIINCPPEEYTRASLPFLAAVLLEMAILVFMPQVVLFIRKSGLIPRGLPRFKQRSNFKNLVLNQTVL